MIPPDETTQRCFDTLLAATAADDFERFVSVADERFRRGLTPEAFHRVCQGLAPRLLKGFKPTLLGELQQKRFTTFLWRLRFDDGGDDALFRMAMADGRVVGALVGPAFS